MVWFDMAGLQSVLLLFPICIWVRVSGNVDNTPTHTTFRYLCLNMTLVREPLRAYMAKSIHEFVNKDCQDIGSMVSEFREAS